ncbi:metallothionein-like protein type 2 [Camellia sinensis]|uniref:metallothionein-like protein type 2 n=1 Tax=Camellia sinensis TaxID=4442 RepID=UPI0010361AF3|nr:metallothionein-like protein type 2 [Camellia sinensis]
MSCCGGNCGCSGGCKCGNGCRGHFEGSEMGVGAENGCKCGANCSCDPCTCK